MNLFTNLFGIPKLEKYQIDAALKNFEKNGFIKIISHKIIRAEEAYLEFVVEKDSIEIDKINFFLKYRIIFQKIGKLSSVLGTVFTQMERRT